MNDAIHTDNKFAAIPNWVIESGVTPQAGWLYVWLKKYADYSTDVAFPSRKTLATKLGLSKAASVDRYIAELECLGALKVAPRWDQEKDGRQTSNLYTVVTANPRVTHETPPVPYRGQGVSPTADGARPVQGTQTKNQITKNQKNELRTADADALLVSEDLSGDPFDDWWKLYPLKKSKQDAKDAYAKALKKHKPVHLMKMLEAYLEGRKRDQQSGNFVANLPYASTWLNQERWTDYTEAPMPTTVRYDPWSKEAYSA